MSPVNTNRTTGGAAAAAGAAPDTASTIARAAALRGMRRVGELAELARDQVGRLFSDVHRMVPDALQAARDDQHTQAPLALLGPELEHVLDSASICAVDQIVELDE